MQSIKKLCPSLSLLFVILFCQCKSPVSQYSVSNVHSHNDYEKPQPFYAAYNAGFGSIEADVFARDGHLVVAHSKDNIKPENTLKDLYIDPLAKQLAVNNNRHLLLLIDIKENHQLVLPLLAKELSPLYPYLSAQGVPGKVTVVISGERPDPSAYSQYPSFIYFDDNLQQPHDAAQWQRVALVSLPFDKISKWKGTGEIDPAEKQRLQHVIDSVHTQGKQIRFWAAPDTKESHILQMKMHADYIGTDHIQEMADFFKATAK